MYLEGILWLLTCPLFVLLSLYLSKYFIAKYETREETKD